ncbi:MAG: hypothetical protein QMD96_01940 [Anaerosomatales bacterium]|nr:hypothetical protein [Anaerosomatales bacterium]
MRQHLTLWSRIDRDRLATIAALAGASVLVIAALVTETLCLGFGWWGLYEWGKSVVLEQQYMALKDAQYAWLRIMSWKGGTAVQDEYEREIQAALNRVSRREPSSPVPFLVLAGVCARVHFIHAV